MPVRFRRISEAQIEETRVTLHILRRRDGAILGRVSTLAYGDEGVELMSTKDADPPIATALKLAVELARFKEQDVDVVDPDRLWQPDWGDLTEG